MLLCCHSQLHNPLLQAGLLSLKLAERLRCCGCRFSCGFGGSCVLCLERLQGCGHLSLLRTEGLQLCSQLSGLHVHSKDQCRTQEPYFLEQLPVRPSP